MIIKDYNQLLHGPLVPNLALESKKNSQENSIFSVISDQENHVFIRFKPMRSDLKQQKGVEISYFATKMKVKDPILPINALSVAVLDYLDVHDLDFVTIAFEDLNMSAKNFAEIVHGFVSHQNLPYSPFLTLQWKPTRTEKGICFTYTK